MKQTSEDMTESKVCKRGNDEPQQDPPGGNYGEPTGSEGMVRESRGYE